MGRFADLLAEPGVEEQVVLGSTFGFMAFHGGSLEVGTDPIAVAAASASGSSVYVVRQPPGLRWHVPSRDVDPAASAPLRRFLDHVDVAVAVHGYGRAGRWTTLMAGGSNRDLAGRVATAIEQRLPEYDVVCDLDAIPVELRGLNPTNPVNRPRQGGVQLELPPRIRGNGPFWDGHPSRAEGRPTPHTEALVAALAEVATGW
ncbi:MAG: poly-gamma-glutamate hydrolase family protein [Acidimicrobiia bacterium]|nr:poly-gamma-glutamate hydrolase family protein [Acidimicrobiia bacterium]